MPSSTPIPELQVPAVRSVSTSRTRSSLTFELEDGRSVTVPLDWFPRLKEGTEKERKNWQLIGSGHGVHWPDLDEDISVESLVLGRRSMESDRSFRAWLERRDSTRRTRRRPPSKRGI